LHERTRMAVHLTAAEDVMLSWVALCRIDYIRKLETKSG
jgi:hypothetical protein